MDNWDCRVGAHPNKDKHLRSHQARNFDSIASTLLGCLFTTAGELFMNGENAWGHQDLVSFASTPGQYSRCLGLNLFAFLVHAANGPSQLRAPLLGRQLLLGRQRFIWLWAWSAILHLAMLALPVLVDPTMSLIEEMFGAKSARSDYVLHGIPYLGCLLHW